MNGDMKYGSWEEAVTWLRSHPDKGDLVREAYYDDPLLAAADRYYHSEEWQAIRKYLSPCRGTALDIGAGRGIASYSLAKDGFFVTALEPNTSAIVGTSAIRTLAADGGIAIHVVEEYSEQLPFPDEEFDVVFARAVLHHTKDLNAVCKEIFRVLKPGGRFIGVREHVITRQSDLPHFLAAHPLHQLYGGENAFALNVYLSAIRGAGMQLKHCLTPLSSPINFSPRTLCELRQEIIARLCSRSCNQKVIGWLLSIPGAWALTFRLIGLVDNRPGRMYSFICEKPKHR
jgi:SAM-dependent methyltransferase